MRTCSRCKLEKILDDFVTDSRRSLGKTFVCKLCRASIQAKSWKKHQVKRVKNNREYMRNHPGLEASYTKAYRSRNPFKTSIDYQNRRALLLGSIGTFTVAEWENLLLFYNHKCLSCGACDVPLQRDHVVPLSQGGSNLISNIQPLCRLCNQRKHNKILDYRPNIVILDKIS